MIEKHTKMSSDSNNGRARHALIVAVEQRNAVAVGLLLQRGAHVNAADDAAHCGDTVLHAAMRQPHPAVLRQLLQQVRL